jgi:hypothetical protein
VKYEKPEIEHSERIDHPLVVGTQLPCGPTTASFTEDPPEE